MDSIFRFIYEFRRYGHKEIIQINGQVDLIKYLNDNFWHSAAPFSDKLLEKERNQIFTLGKDDYITNLRFGYDVWRVF